MKTNKTKIQNKEVKEKPKCPACKSGQVYLRFTSMEFVCRTCGNVWKKEK